MILFVETETSVKHYNIQESGVDTLHQWAAEIWIETAKKTTTSRMKSYVLSVC